MVRFTFRPPFSSNSSSSVLYVHTVRPFIVFKTEVCGFRVFLSVSSECFPHRTNHLIFVMERLCVSLDVRTGF